MDNKEALRRLQNDRRPKVKESAFRDIYLPLLMDNENPESRIRWIREVAQTVNQEVDVVDDQDVNNILFWVPPYMRSPKDVDPDVYEIDPVIQERNRMLPLWGDRADKTMARNLKELFNPPAPAKSDVDQWEYILTRYDKYSFQTHSATEERGFTPDQGTETEEW